MKDELGGDFKEFAALGPKANLKDDNDENKKTPKIVS